ncbi:DUF6382 domain-containing protein [Clostridium sp. E02]|uniref:DUF6382 domain-containing protein n=1 Tax=Clostridium sp. E02 TaxID=2487134 RepID=UPI000F536416|nr:DUF6382 domain-containing protein [Clostridium sp. E02]
MKITYKRELKHNYLIIEPEEAGYQGYDLYMFESNDIEGLLKFHSRQTDNRRTYYYEITSKQPLSRILEYHSLGKEELKKLIGGILSALDRLEKYLLKEDCIILEPEYIYVEPERFAISLCLIPGKASEFPAKMTELLRYLLGKVDHQDKECVVMAYSLYQESLKENYGVHNLLDRMGEKAIAVKEIERDHVIEEKTKIDPVTVDKPLEGSEHRELLSQKSNMGLSILVGIVAMTSGFGVLWFLRGGSGIQKYWYLCVVLGLIPALLMKRCPEKGNSLIQKEPDKKEHEEWKVAFEEEPEEIKKEQEQIEEEEVLQTVLLTSGSTDKGVRYLKAVGSDLEDIVVSYTPFLIGKQEGIVDYAVNREGISRIHARIDWVEEGYEISDLNSTNGTTVNGRMLETNETLSLKKGDEIFLANYGFIFT